MPALRAEIYQASYRTTRSPFPDATDVYILGSLNDTVWIDANGPSGVPLDAANVVILDPRTPALGPIFRPAIWIEGETQETSGWAFHPDQFAMGGRYIATSDSRFSQLIRKATGSHFYGAIPLHDYSMTAEYRDNATAATLHNERAKATT